ncbi:MAG: T9SS type A sorting domain-containing protein [Calditrichaeota bacterium]|nr:T9SS type A sorting domain-containing protein [Calditrichota bacterium]MCB9367699.1 T9SS type A sorting domain-containing protein [Calditrichota bacterium]
MKKLILTVLLGLLGVTAAWAQTGNLSVTVVAGDVPLQGVLVNVEAEGHGGPGRPHFSGTTDETGVILFADIPAMEYEVMAGLPGVHPEHAHVDVLEGETAEVTLTFPSFDPAPRISVRPDNMHFGPVGVGTTFTRNLDIENRGQLDLTVSIALEGDAFGLGAEPDFTLIPGEEVDFPVTFTPADTIGYTGTLTITSNDPDHGTIIVPLTGFGAVIITGGLSVNVIVTDSNDVASAVDSARVRVSFIRDHGGPRPQHFVGFTDAEGNVTVDAIPVGVYNVNADKPGIGFASDVIEITEDQTSFLTLELVAADSSEHGHHDGHHGHGHHFEIVELAGTAIVTAPDTLDPTFLLYALDVDADGIADYRLNFGPADYDPGNGATRPNDGDEIIVTGALMSHGTPPMVHVYTINGMEWWIQDPANDGAHGGDAGGRATGFGTDNNLVWVEITGTVSVIDVYGDAFYGLDTDNDGVTNYVIDFGDNYNVSSPAIPSLGENVSVVGGLLNGAPEALNADWVIVYEVDGQFFRMPGDTEGLEPIDGSTSVNPTDAPVVSSHLVATNYPNPFNPTTNIQFSTPVAGLVNITVFDVLGRQVATLVNDNLTAGTYTTQFNAASLPSGMYMYRVTVNNQSIVNRMLLLK